MSCQAATIFIVVARKMTYGIIIAKQSLNGKMFLRAPSLFYLEAHHRSVLPSLGCHMDGRFHQPLLYRLFQVTVAPKRGNVDAVVKIILLDHAAAKGNSGAETYQGFSVNAYLSTICRKKKRRTNDRQTGEVFPFLPQPGNTEA